MIKIRDEIETQNQATFSQITKEMRNPERLGGAPVTVPLGTLFAPPYLTARPVFARVGLFGNLTVFERVLLDLFAGLVLLIALALLCYPMLRLYASLAWKTGVS